MVTATAFFLENRRFAAGTINGPLAAVRRLAYEAAGAGLLSPELAAGIRRVKGAKKLGVRLGNWLTGEEGRRFWRRVHRVGNWIRSNSFSGTSVQTTELSRLQAADSRTRE